MAASMESAQRIVIAEWQRRRAVQLDTSGGWHTCHRERCTIRHLQEYVCLQGQHIVSGPACPLHPGSDVLRVSSLYGCAQVGAIHVCSQSAGSCVVVDGKCTISGLSCVAAHQPATTVSAPPGKRSRRRQPGVHTNHKTASIMIFNLLFSRRRITSEIARAQATMEQGRRTALRYIKLMLRSEDAVRYQAVVDIINQARQTVRDTRFQYLCRESSTREQVCLYYAGIVDEMWDLLMDYLPTRNTFEAVCAAVLYAMRKGLAYDGLYAIPPDRFLLCALPDAHSIKDIGISRRAFTQSRNALYTAVRDIVGARKATVEEIAAKFKRDDQPVVLKAHFPQRSDE